MPTSFNPLAGRDAAAHQVNGFLEVARGRRAADLTGPTPSESLYGHGTIRVKSLAVSC